MLYIGLTLDDFIKNWSTFTEHKQILLLSKRLLHYSAITYFEWKCKWKLIENHIKLFNCVKYSIYSKFLYMFPYTKCTFFFKRCKCQKLGKNRQKIELRIYMVYINVYHSVFLHQIARSYAQNFWFFVCLFFVFFLVFFILNY